MSNQQTTTGAAASRHGWRFFRAGGVDQVTFRNGSDIANLEHLDLKLWLALAMPTRGIEFDTATLDLIDTDKDGRIRPPELLAAIAWARNAFTSLDGLLKGGDSVELANIKDEGIRKGAQRILATVKKSDATAVSLGDALGMAREIAQTTFNGDGVVPADSATDDATKQAITDIIAALGPVTDRSGKPGVDQPTLDKFFADAQALSDWLKKAEGDQSLAPAGEGTPAALAAVNAIKAKVDDYFARGRLAAFDSRATAAVNRQEAEYLAIAAQDLTVTAQEVAGFPLAKIEPNKPLPLKDGVNPAWAAALARLASDAVTPLLGAPKTILTEAEWTDLQARLAPFAAYQSSKPATPVEKLGMERLRELLAGKERETIAALVAEDLALKPEFDQLAGVEKLLRFQRDLVKLLVNYANFAEFYGLRGAVFQAGTLYLDARACRLCVEVTDAGKHATLAGLAGIYLAYCDITRPGAAKRTIVAAFTDGDADNLMVGRNGVFYDRKGLDWDATITKVVANPISLREAFWSPYKKLLRMIEEMVAKRAAAADAAADKKLAGAATAVSSADQSKPAEPKKIDVGTVAALGVAVGAIGAAIAGLATGVMKLAWWQIPLVFVGIILLISLPSMVIAWLKLRRRNIAPLLDANGWAINTRAKINTPFGAALTDIAKLPAGAERSLDDPFAEKKTPWGLYLFIAVLVIAAVWIRVDSKKRGHYFWQKKPVAAAVTNAPGDTNITVEVQASAPAPPAAPQAPAQ
jgi:hypothetical protein